MGGRHANEGTVAGVVDPGRPDRGEPARADPAALAALLAPLVADPARSAVCTDFDGTLAPIVDEAAAARPVAGVTEVLGELAARYAVVAVLSGRPVSFIAPLVPPGVTVSGLYGLEAVVDGEVIDHPDAGHWRPVVADAAAAAERDAPAGVQVERKGLSLTLHYRAVPGSGDAVRDWAQRAALESGLDLRLAKMSVELHPPIAADKGTALRALIDDVAAVCFLGDDVGDLPAFATLAALAAEGVAVAGIAVAGPEAPPEVLAAADAVVDGPEGALEVLRLLAR